MNDNDKIVNMYILTLSEKIDSNPSFSMFKDNNPDFDKELVLKEARIIAYENMQIESTPNLKPYQFLDILKYIKKSNEICKLLEANHAYITHINSDGTLHYVFTNYGQKSLNSMGLI